jgi:hypothetical protein
LCRCVKKKISRSTQTLIPHTYMTYKQTFSPLSQVKCHSNFLVLRGLGFIRSGFGVDCLLIRVKSGNSW